MLILKYLTYDINENSKTQVKKNNINQNILEYCYMPFDNTTIKIIHLIMKRFMIEFGNTNGFPNQLYADDYILNVIRIMKNYLFKSLIR